MRLGHHVGVAGPHGGGHLRALLAQTRRQRAFAGHVVACDHEDALRGRGGGAIRHQFLDVGQRFVREQGTQRLDAAVEVCGLRMARERCAHLARERAAAGAGRPEHQAADPAHALRGFHRKGRAEAHAEKCYFARARKALRFLHRCADARKPGVDTLPIRVAAGRIAAAVVVEAKHVEAGGRERLRELGVGAVGAKRLVPQWPAEHHRNTARRALRGMEPAQARARCGLEGDGAAAHAPPPSMQAACAELMAQTHPRPCGATAPRSAMCASSPGARWK